MPSKFSLFGGARAAIILPCLLVLALISSYDCTWSSCQGCKCCRVLHSSLHLVCPNTKSVLLQYANYTVLLPAVVVLLVLLILLVFFLVFFVLILLLSCWHGCCVVSFLLLILLVVWSYLVFVLLVFVLVLYLDGHLVVLAFLFLFLLFVVAVVAVVVGRPFFAVCCFFLLLILHLMIFFLMLFLSLWLSSLLLYCLRFALGLLGAVVALLVKVVFVVVAVAIVLACVFLERLQGSHTAHTGPSFRSLDFRGVQLTHMSGFLTTLSHHTRRLAKTRGTPASYASSCEKVYLKISNVHIVNQQRKPTGWTQTPQRCR